MANLGPQRINQSFGDLLQLPNGLTSAIQNVQDGSGNVTPLEISTTVVDFPISSPSGASGMMSDLATDVGSNYIGFLQSGNNAETDRSIQDKLREWVSVKDFGATGDGSTNDTLSIQNAINSLNANQGGYTIYFPPGVYKITQTLVIGSRRITLRGPTLTGSNSAQIKKTGLPNIDFIDAGSGIVDTFSMFDLQLQGDGLAGSGNGVILGNLTTFVADCRIENCWFNQIPNAALYMVNAGGYHINNNGFEQSYYAIYFPANVVTTNNLNVIENNRFYSCQTAIFSAYGQYQTIVGNIFDDCGQTNDTTGAIVLNTTGPEIRAWSIASNKFRANYNDVVLIGPSSRPAHTGVTTNSIIGNHSEFAQRHFVYALSTDGVAILGNYINDPGQQTDNTFAAIDIQGGATVTTVDGNVVRYASGVRPRFGLQTGSSTTGTKIGQNDLSGLIAASNLGGTYSYLVAGEESAFTPTMFGASSAGITTYTTQAGYYQRNGQCVHFSARITWSAATGTGFMCFGGLPYNAQSTSNLLNAVTIGYATLAAGDITALTAYIAPNNTYININKYAAGSTTALNVESTGDVCISGSYFVN